MVKKPTNLDSYRRHRKEKSEFMWLRLNAAFDRLKIPGSVRNELMFMKRDDFLAWGRGEHIASLEKVELAIKYTRLYRALFAMCGDDAIAHHWLFNGNNGHRRLFKGRSPLETILEDGERVIEDVIATLRQP